MPSYETIIEEKGEPYSAPTMLTTFRFHFGRAKTTLMAPAATMRINTRTGEKN
jgi:hypothetical protein